MDNSGSNKYHFYEYLYFFWKKKWFFLILPSLFLAIALVISFVQKPAYLGQATVYTGYVKKETLLQTDLIKNEMDAIFGENKQYSVTTGDKRILFTKEGLNKEEIINSLEGASNKYYEEILTYYKEDLQTKEGEIERTKNRIDEFTTFINKYKERMDSNNLDAENENWYTELFIDGEKTIVEFESSLDQMEIELKTIIDEEPRKLGTVVNVSKTHIKSNILASIVLGLFLSLLLMTLWKYIEDARRNNK